MNFLRVITGGSLFYLVVLVWRAVVSALCALLSFSIHCFVLVSCVFRTCSYDVLTNNNNKLILRHIPPIEYNPCVLITAAVLTIHVL